MVYLALQMMNQTSITSPQQQKINIQVGNSRPRRPNLAPLDLIYGDRLYYLEVVVPLYKASISCNWKAAKTIIEKRPDLVRYSITENGDTALHLAATAERSEWFVKYLVDMMRTEDLELENKNYKTALYLAVVAGNVETVKNMVERNKGLLTIPGANGQMMPLYAAAVYGNHKVTRYLYEKSNELCDDDGWNPESRRQLLEKLVEFDMFDVALLIVRTYPQLGSGRVLVSLAQKPDAFSETKPRNLTESITESIKESIISAVGAYKKESEALQLLKIIWNDIAKRPKKEIDDILRGPPESKCLIQALPLQKVIFEHLGKLDVETENIMGGAPNVDSDKAQNLQELITAHLLNIQEVIQQDNTQDTSLELQKIISNHLVMIRYEYQNIVNQVCIEEEDQASYLQRLIFKHITKMNALSGLSRKQYSSRVLFIAAKVGNVDFLVELIRLYPDLIWKVNDEYQTIFHVAVKYRHEGIYRLLYEIGSMKDSITPLRDIDDNNMFHLVGKRATKTQLAPGAAFQMQKEILWFMEVKRTIPPSFREQRNKDGLTPTELFFEEHKELIKEGEKWMKETATQCMVAAALIATIVFAAAFTIPGGYNQDNGIPVFYRKSIFAVFVIADAISLLLSSTSILILLSIFISRYSEFDFMESLPRKLLLGMATLYLSIIAMIFTFSVSFFILYDKEIMWIPIVIGVLAGVPILLFPHMQLNMVADVFNSTFDSTYLFMPKKRLLSM